MYSELLEYIESKDPCEEYDEYVSKGILTSKSTVSSILLDKRVMPWDKDWLTEKIEMELQLPIHRPQVYAYPDNCFKVRHLFIERVNSISTRWVARFYQEAFDWLMEQREESE